MSKNLFIDEKLSAGEADIGIAEAFRRLLPFLREQRRRLILAMGLLAGVTGFSLLWPVLVQRAIDGPLLKQLELPGAERDFDPVLWYGLAIILIQLSTIVMQYWQRVKLEIVGQDIMLKLKEKLFDHILALDVSFFDKNPVGRLMARIESDTESLRLLFTFTVVAVVGDIVLMAGIYIVMFVMAWKLALVLILFAPIFAVLVYIFHKLTSHRYLRLRKRSAEVSASLTEFLHGMSIVQIFHRGEYARMKVNEANQRKFEEDKYVNIAVCVFFNVMFYLEYVKIGVTLLIGPMLGVSPGVIVLFILLVWREFDPIARTAEQLGNFQKGLAGARRIFGLLQVNPKILESSHPVEWPGFRKSLRFESVWFSYNDDENFVLKDATFEIPVGSRVALAGVTGGGKTTVINLLLRFYDPQKGRITIDGVDIKEMEIADLRHHFALVLQDIILFPGSVKNNIGLEAEEVPLERILSAASTVAADRFINKLPKGFETEVSEKGSNFSRGERQLLSFARALAFDPELLILDEATSSVDPETERSVQKALGKLLEGRTSLIIAHRLSTILDADQILVIRKGEIVERGTHAQLILANGYYSKLFHLQFKSKNGAVANV